MFVRLYLRIICEDEHNQWTAWFEQTPQVAASGEYPAEAVDNLLEIYANMLEADEISSCDAGTREGHLELLIPVANWRRIPIPSIN